jgi:P-type E1-E2 ATPase
MPRPRSLPLPPATQVGDTLKVLPGASIPTDGELLAGATAVDESMLTGEALPVAKAAGDALIGGSVNGQVGGRVSDAGACARGGEVRVVQGRRPHRGSSWRAVADC